MLEKRQFAKLSRYTVYKLFPVTTRINFKMPHQNLLLDLINQKPHALEILCRNVI